MRRWRCGFVVFVVVALLSCGPAGTGSRDDHSRPEDDLGHPFPDVADADTSNDFADHGLADADRDGWAGESAAADLSDGLTPGAAGYASPELLLKILDPAADGWAEQDSATARIRGVIVGQADSISWHSNNGQTGTAAGLPYFQTGAIPLTRGDNLITVTARGPNFAMASDSVVVTYNPDFSFDGPVRLRSAAAFVAEPTVLYATVAMGRYEQTSSTSVHLWACGADGSPQVDLGAMKDDGDTPGSGDEIQHDGVFTLRWTFVHPDPANIALRAAVPVTVGTISYTAYSRPARLEVLDRLQPADCESIVALQREARQAWGRQQATDPIAARAAALAVLRNSDLVAEAGGNDDGNGIWASYHAGVLGALTLVAPGARGVGRLPWPEGAPIVRYPEETTAYQHHPASRHALLLDPFDDDFATADEMDALAHRLAQFDCPPFAVDGPLQGELANVARLRDLSAYGLLFWAGYGDVYFRGLSAAVRQGLHWEHDGSQEVLFTGEPVDCSRLQTAPQACPADGCPAPTICVPTGIDLHEGLPQITGDCVDATQIDLMAGRLVLGDRTLGVLPSFFAHHGRQSRLPQSVVYLAGGSTAANGSLFSALSGVGALAVIGFTGPVRSTFAAEAAGQTLLPALGTANGLAAAMAGVGFDPDEPNTTMRLLGAVNLDLADAELSAADFEIGLSGWSAGGDVRVVQRLGSSRPMQGTAMAFLSTGLGFSLSAGTLRQHFCIPADRFELSFYWKFFSEEFHENCGTGYQDRFQAELVGSATTVPLIDVSIDDLCRPSDCPDCGSQYESLTAADVQFDQGDTHRTHWRQARANVQALAGRGPVELVFSTGDRGDSLFDSAVLIDAIRIR